MTQKTLKTVLGAAIAASVLSATPLLAADNDSLSSDRMAEIYSVYYNDAPTKPSSTEALTPARMEVISASYDEYLMKVPAVDGLSASQMARIEQHYDDYIGAPQGRSITFAKAPIQH